jgi:hypothetical protein
MGDIFNYEDNFDDDDLTMVGSPRFDVVYVCEDGHETTVTMSTNADIPNEWTCLTCSKNARLKNSDIPMEAEPEPKPDHWAKLIQRRTIEELDEMLEERIKLIKSGKVGKVFS